MYVCLYMSFFYVLKNMTSLFLLEETTFLQRLLFELLISCSQHIWQKAFIYLFYYSRHLGKKTTGVTNNINNASNLFKCPSRL